jgi:hypothetical protein
MQISVEFFRRHLSPFWQPELLMTQLFVQIICRIQQLTTTFLPDAARELVPTFIDAFRGTKIMSDKKRAETLVPAIVTLFARPRSSRAFHCRSHLDQSEADAGRWSFARHRTVVRIDPPLKSAGFNWHFGGFGPLGQGLQTVSPQQLRNKQCHELTREPEAP